MVSPWSSLLGGVLIGLGAALLLLGNGRIAGISGIFGGVLNPTPGDTLWRVLFVVGLVSTGVVAYLVYPAAFAAPSGRSLFSLGIAGLLVGYGTRLGNGCTSGHGICGIGRFSPRSIVATLTFMATSALTVFVVRHGLGGGR